MHLMLRAVLRRRCNNRSISPSCRAHSSEPAVATCGGRTGQTDRQTRTDERTPDSCIDAAAHTMRAVPMNLFCSLAVLDPRVGHTMDVLSPFISVLCHYD